MSFLGGLAGGAIGGAVVNLYLDSTQFNAGLAQAEAKTASAATGVGKFGGVASAAYAAAGAAAIAFAASSVKAFAESEEVMAQTEAVIKSTGASAGFSAIGIQQMAAALQDQTAFSDEAIQSAENLLLTFTKIGHDIFPDATQAALDLATRFEMDLGSAAKMVGKALNDPIAGLTALSRAGVQFQPVQKEMIKNLVETGRSAEAQAIIMKELTIQTGGAAAAAANTYSGKIAQLSNTFNDFQEAVGKELVPALEAFLDVMIRIAEVLPTILPQIERLVGLVEKGVPALDAFFGAMQNDDWGAFQSGAEGVAQALESGDITFREATDRIEELADASGVALPEGANAMVLAMLDAQHGATGLAGATDEVTTKMREARKAAKEAAKEYREGVKEAFDISGESVIGFKAKFEGTVRQFIRGLHNMRQQAHETLENLKEFNNVDMGKGVREFLLDQGPAAIDQFVDANKHGRDDIVATIKDIIDTQQAQGVQIDEATGKTRGLSNAMEALGRKKVTAEARIKYMLSEDSLDPGSLPGLSKAGT